MIDTAAGPVTVLVEVVTLSATFLEVGMGCGRRRGHSGPAAAPDASRVGRAWTAPCAAESRRAGSGQ